MDGNQLKETKRIQFNEEPILAVYHNILSSVGLPGATSMKQETAAILTLAAVLQEASNEQIHQGLFNNT